MSLLFINNEQYTYEIAKQIMQEHLRADPLLEKEYDERRKKLMFEDIRYNLEYLETSIQLDDENIFINYADWLFRLLCYLMDDLDNERIKEQVISHYHFLDKNIQHVFAFSKYQKAHAIINKAIENTENASSDEEQGSVLGNGQFGQYKAQYLELLSQNRTKEAVMLLQDAFSRGINLEDIYVNVVQDIMYEIGNMWYTQKISVDREHYSTSVTQTALAQFYPEIFKSARNGFRAITACVGSELHEMGIRMVSDLLEYNGWDSFYLGAAVPQEGIVNAIEEYNPHLLALSVTMPHHLPICLEIVKAVRNFAPDLKIAIGGRAFDWSNRIWEKWPVDFYAKNARELIKWAEETIVNSEVSDL